MLREVSKRLRTYLGRSYAHGPEHVRFAGSYE